MKLEKKDFKILKKETILKWPIFDIVKAKIKLPNKQIVEWAYMEGSDIVGGVVLTSKNEIILTKEFRAAANDMILQLPAGRVKKAKTEKERINELNRELQEEIGIRGKKIEKLSTALVGSHIKQKYHIYLVRDLLESKLKPDDGEFIDIVKLPYSKAIDLILSGKYNTTFETIAGLLLAKYKIEKT